jgi:pimeloyl-ACP methyl ester carboxylesterase
MKTAYKTQAGKTEVLSFYDSLLDRMTVPHETINIDTRKGETFIIAAGENTAPPLILLHGSSLNAGMWIGDMAKYQNCYRVYAPDMPGEAGRSDEHQYPFTTDDYSEWLFDVFDRLGIAKAFVVGASLGAWLAAKFAICYPPMVSKLVLLCPAGFGSQHKAFIFVALFYMLMGDKGIKRLFEKINGDEVIPEIIVEYQTLIAKNFNIRKEQIPLFTDDEIKKLTMPSMLIVGGKDVILKSHETAERYGRLVTDARIKMLPDAGHSLPDTFDLIINFFHERL